MSLTSQLLAQMGSWNAAEVAVAVAALISALVGFAFLAVSIFRSPRPTIQFSMGGILWATLWLGVGFALLRMTACLGCEFDSIFFQIIHRATVAVPIGGFIGIYQKHPVAGGVIALVIWFLVMVVFLPGIQAARE